MKEQIWYTNVKYLCKCRFLILFNIDITMHVFSQNRIFYSVTQAIAISSNMASSGVQENVYLYNNN